MLIRRICLSVVKCDKYINNQDTCIHLMTNEKNVCKMK